MVESLIRYPRPNVAVDIALFTVAPRGELMAEACLALVVQRTTDNLPGLPGRFLRKRQRVADAIEDVVTLKLGLKPGRVHPVLLEVFSHPDRDPRGWTLSIAYSLAMPWTEAQQTSAEILPLTRSGLLRSREHLAYDHDQILDRALARLRERYEAAPDPDGLLPPPFTLTKLRRLHELVLGEELRRDTFNRRMKDKLSQVRDATGEPVLHVESVGRPAQVFTYGAEGRGELRAPSPPGYSLPRKSDPYPPRRSRDEESGSNR